MQVMFYADSPPSAAIWRSKITAVQKKWAVDLDHRVREQIDDLRQHTREPVLVSEVTRRSETREVLRRRSSRFSFMDDEFHGHANHAMQSRPRAPTASSAPAVDSQLLDDIAALRQELAQIRATQLGSPETAPARKLTCAEPAAAAREGKETKKPKRAPIGIAHTISGARERMRREQAHSAGASKARFVGWLMAEEIEDGMSPSLAPVAAEQPRPTPLASGVQRNMRRLLSVAEEGDGRDIELGEQSLGAAGQQELAPAPRHRKGLRTSLPRLARKKRSSKSDQCVRLWTRRPANRLAIAVSLRAWATGALLCRGGSCRAVSCRGSWSLRRWHLALDSTVHWLAG